ncbi:unnamed protein product [Prunus brigantina]
MRTILLTRLPGLVLLSPPTKVLFFIRHLKNPHGLLTWELQITFHFILANLLVANHPLRRWCLMLMVPFPCGWEELSISLSTSLQLDSVFLVPSMDHNLLSVAQLTTTLGCTVTFWPNHCVC